MTDFIDDSILRDYVAYVWRVLKEFLPGNDLRPSYDKDALDPLKSRLQTVGLEMGLSYPVVHLGSEHARLLALSFEEYLRSNKVRLLTSTTAQVITLRANAIEIKLEKGADSTSIQCRYLIAAVGKSGHDWLLKQFKQWDIIPRPNTPYIGIRLEFPNAVTQQLLQIAKNPRIVMNWNNTSIKTHCWCYGGRITTYDYLGSTIVDGETFMNSLTKYTSVNLLYHFKGNQDHVKDVRRLLQEISQMSKGYPLRQSLGALRGDRHPFQPLEGSACSKNFQEAQLENMFPKVITEGFLEFIRRMGRVWPGIADRSTHVYAPVIEWDTYQLPVDENMSTSIPNVYAVGDGAGLSQGIVTAATCGLIAAKHLSQSYLSMYTREGFVETISH